MEMDASMSMSMYTIAKICRFFFVLSLLFVVVVVVFCGVLLTSSSFGWKRKRNQ